jgi:hypothetical protein
LTRPFDDRRSLTLGLVLLFLGAFFLLRDRFFFSGPAPILLLIGGILFAASALRGFGEPLLPAGVLLGLGTGLLLQNRLSRWMPEWSILLLGLGAGFLLVAAIDHAVGRSRRPRPVVPGAALVAIAFFAFLSWQLRLGGALEVLADLWPWALVAAGIVLVLQATMRSRKTGDGRRETN